MNWNQKDARIYHLGVSSKARKKMAWICIFSIFLQICMPLSTYALTSGPNQPEFSSFEPVATTNMVNEFTGDFTYNLPVIEIPGPEGSGYALSLSYHSGTSPEEEASWVGYGWTLNPGAIIRNKQGFPDDFKGEDVIYHNDVPANWTASVGAQIGELEGFSIDVPLSFNASLRYNNYRGFGYTAGLGLSYKGIASLGYNLSDGDGSFSLSVNPAALLADQKNKGKDDQIKDETQRKIAKLTRYGKYKRAKLGRIDFSGSNYGLLSKNWFSQATSTQPYTGTAVNISGSFEATPSFLPAGAQLGLFGSYVHQMPLKEQTLSAYGYMYAGYANESSIQDYYLEKESPYHKRDKFLAIPFSNPDHFSVTGEGLGGGFRLRNKNAGHYFPNSAFSLTQIENVGVEFQGGANVGVGADITPPGGGEHSLSVNKWGGYDDEFSFAKVGEEEDEAVFFRFKNDLGGSISFGNIDPAVTAGVDNSQSPDLSGLGFDADFHANGYNSTQFNGRSGRSSYIGYHTNKEIKESVESAHPDHQGQFIHYQSYTKDAAALALVDRENPTIENGIGEIITTNEDGYTYTFGLPVFARNEANLQYGFKQINPGDIEGGLIVHKDVEDASSIKFKVGEERNAPYATSYLLTGITSPDYIDRYLDGPTHDDFGAYTRFVYERHMGEDNKSESSDNWYKWRMPYTGFFYNRNSLSNKKDDASSVVYGEKEVYYLDTIETKTHFAVFHTSPRADGIGAAEESVAASNPSPVVSDHLLRLDNITLHARNPETGELIPQWLQRVNFEYNYELMHDLPNSNHPDKGKLTLKRVWTDYNGIIQAKIAPYEFQYTYPDIAYPSPYEELSNYGVGMIQNPSYNPINLDPWGNYQTNGAERYANMRPWVDQRKNPTFDPAAWQLKVIKLPSGGEIHVQYEQKDYQYVQDRRAMAMVRLIENPIFDDLNNPDLDIDIGNKYYLDLEDLGITHTNDDYEENLEKLVALIRKEFVEKDEKIYFKFLYALTGFAPSLDNCNSEFIQGYARINQAQNVGIDDNLDGINRIYVKLGTLNPLDEFSHPRRICIDYAKTNRGNISGGDCDATDGLNTNTGPVELVNQLLNFAGTTFSGGEINCLTLEESLSYIRIPVLKPKKGGGIRVKRLLMYDQSLGEEVLYGNEYLYETLDEIGDTISTGVALNEPAKIREENALITNLEKRTDQGFLEKIFAGKDKEQFEGPIGETLLPAASIGYSKVIVKNIHKGRTSPGFTVKEFYTAKDYPFDGYYTALGRRGVEMTEVNEGDKEWLIIPAGLFNYFKTNLWLTQGFSFIQNDFHGKPRLTATYSGPYANIHNPDAISKTSEQYYEYFEPGQEIPVSMGLDSDMVSSEDLGKETEVIFETKKIEDIAFDLNIEGDFSIGLLPIPPTFPTAYPTYTYSESKLHTHTTVKVSSYPAIVKGIRSYQDGVYTYTKHLQFSRENGRPILTQTTDGYDGLDLEQSPSHEGIYTTYQYAAADIYQALGQRALNEQRIISSEDNSLSIEKSMLNGNFYLTLAGSASADALTILKLGDFIQLNEDMDFYHIGETNGNTLTLYPLASLPHLALTQNEVSQVKILQSGLSNRLNEDAGRLVVYGNDIQVITTITDGNSLAERQQFVDLLNEVLPNGGNAFIDGIGVELPFSSNQGIPPNFCDTTCLIRITHAGTTQNNLGEDITHIRFGCHIHPNGLSPYCQFSVKRSDTPDEDEFYLGVSGQIGYHAADGPFEDNIIAENCAFCGDSTGILQTVAGVIDVNLSPYSDQWPLLPQMLATYDIDPTESYSPFEIGARGKWRPKTNYVYRQDIIPGIDEYQANTQNRVYKQAGTFTMEVFDWENLSANDPEKWLKINQTNLYSPHGQALEEENIRGIKSAAKYGYQHTMPYLIAQNADYQSVYFESFENHYNGYLEEHVSLGSNQNGLTQETYHSGRQSLSLKTTPPVSQNGYTASFVAKSMQITQQMKEQGVDLKVWLSSRKLRNGRSSWGTPPLFSLVGVGNAPLTFVARAGEWHLFEAHIPPNSFDGTNIGALITPRIDFLDLYPTYPATDPNRPEDEIWIDDVGIQLADAQMNCFVYDPATYRLLTSFDDQHFGLFYQYNAQGQLVRQMVETEQGLKTVKETQYHTPKNQTRN